MQHTQRNTESLKATSCRNAATGQTAPIDFAACLWLHICAGFICRTLPQPQTLQKRIYPPHCVEERDEYVPFCGAGACTNKGQYAGGLKRKRIERTYAFDDAAHDSMIK